jgi:hypothetical protein
MTFTTDLKNHLEAQKTANSQGNIEQKEQCWRYHNTWLQTILQSHSNKNIMVLAQKQIWRPAKQNRRLRYESIWLHPPDFLTNSPKTYNEEKTASSTNVAGKTGYLHAENWNEINICHLELVSTQSILRTLMGDLKLWS